MEFINYEINRYRDTGNPSADTVRQMVYNYYKSDNISEKQYDNLIQMIDDISLEKNYSLEDKNVEKLFDPDLYIQKITDSGPRKYYKKELPDNYTYGLKFLYDNSQDTLDVEQGGLNLSIKHRPWDSVVPSEIISETRLTGRELFNDAITYKPIYLKNYINKYYIEPFRKYRKDKISPFEFQPDYIKKSSRELCSINKYSLQPQQKFCGQFICNQTDFSGLLIYHLLGSGKTCTGIVIAESMKSSYINEHGSSPIPGRFVEISPKQKVYCNVTIVVPKSIINQYVKEIQGTFQEGFGEGDEGSGSETGEFNGTIKSCTGSCIIYTEKDSKSGEPSSYIQNYIGKIKKDSRGNPLRDANGSIIYEKDELEKLKIIELNISKINAEINSKSDMIISGKLSEKDSRKIEQDIKKLSKQKDTEYTKKNIITSSLDSKINNVYYIISSQSFTNRIGRKQEVPRLDANGNIIYKTDENGNIKYSSDGKPISQNDPSKARLLSTDYLKGVNVVKRRENEPHADCFHSQKSLIIIDEIHKGTSTKEDEEYGVTHEQLFNALYVYSREIVSGAPAMKVVLLTATPVFDNPYQLAMSVNLLRPRIPFSKNIATFEEMFIGTDSDNTQHLKNKILFQRHLSGYISYFKGGNPNGYPMRRNFIQMHKMKYIQAEQYDISIEKDLSEISKRSKLDKEGFSGGFVNSGSVSICALPFKSGKARGKGDYGYIEKLEDIMAKGKNGTSNGSIVFREYSSKLYWIGRKIIASSQKEEGPIFVYSSKVARGILPLIKYLEANGFKLISNADSKKSAKDLRNQNLASGTKMFTILSGEGYRYYCEDNKVRNILTSGIVQEDEYRNNVVRLLNDDLNHDGSICKVILGKVEEGLSFKNISQVHICDPWWNDSRLEQIIGRGIRFCSHALLPEKRQVVDVYYHCSVKDSYNRNVNKKFINTPFDIISVDQHHYSVSRLKNQLKIEFEIALKESAIDSELNKYGNIVRLEEFRISGTEENEEGGGGNGVFVDFTKEITNISGTFYYNRSLDKYYTQTRTGLDFRKSFTEIDLSFNMHYNITSKPVTVWPAISLKETKKIVVPNIFQAVQDFNGKRMLKATMYENIKSDYHNEVYLNSDFEELKKYALSKGEEEFAWDQARDYLIVNKLMPFLLGSEVLVNQKQANIMANNVISSYLSYYEKEKDGSELVRMEEKLFSKKYNDYKNVLINTLLKENIPNMTERDFKSLTVPNLQKLKEEIDRKKKEEREKKRKKF